MTTSPGDERDSLVRLGDAVRRRRIELGLSQRVVAERGGPSVRSLNKIEQGTRLDPRGARFPSWMSLWIGCREPLPLSWPAYLSPNLSLPTLSTQPRISSCTPDLLGRSTTLASTVSRHGP